jgi:release factor glutamine methyltransferase
MVVPLDQRPRSGPYSGLNYRSAKRFMARQFEAADLPFADEDALDLLLGLCGLSHEDYVLHGTDFITAEAFDALRDAADRRMAGEPVDRILGWRAFYGRRFAVDGVLSPRGDTEVLLLAALDALKDTPSPRLIDLGTGSGALAVSVLAERPDATAVATDIEPAALETAKGNADANGVADRLTLLRSDWFAAVEESGFDAVLSNPPYITTEAMGALDREVSEHDPHGALHGGTDGLDPYRILVPGAVARLRPGGWLGVEIGFDQGAAVAALFRASNLADVRVLTDPAGLDRVVCGVAPSHHTSVKPHISRG